MLGLLAQPVVYQTANPRVESSSPMQPDINFMELDPEIISILIFSLLLIYEGQLSINGKSMIKVSLPMFYKIVYGLVTIQLPAYFEHPATNTLFHTGNHIAANYYQFSFFFPVSIFLWNRSQKDVVLLSDFDSFKKAVLRSHSPSHKSKIQLLSYF